MKTKEIEVWVRNDLLEMISQNPDVFMEGIFLNRPHDSERNCLKAKLIIEIPEKTIQLTESQFFEMAMDFEVHSQIKNGPILGSYQEPLVKWSRKLFGSEGDRKN